MPFPEPQVCSRSPSWASPSFPFVSFAPPVIVRAMRFFAVRVSLLLAALVTPAFAGNSVVNLSHYDLMRVDFQGLKGEGIVGIIHEATYPRFDRDSYYGSRQT